MRKTKSLKQAELAKIHIAKKQLGMDDDIYRDILQRVAGVRSAADLDGQGRFLVLRELAACGFKAKPSIGSRPNKRAVTDGQEGKIWSLWHELKDAGLINNDSAPALRTYTKKLTGMDDIRFCDSSQKSYIIETLKGWLRRS